jgi:hypothetical protein
MASRKILREAFFLAIIEVNQEDVKDSNDGPCRDGSLQEDFIELHCEVVSAFADGQTVL